MELPGSMQLMPVLNYSSSPAFQRPVVNTVLINDMNGLGVISAHLDPTHIAPPVKQVHYHGITYKQYIVIFTIAITTNMLYVCNIM